MLQKKRKKKSKARRKKGTKLGLNNLPPKRIKPSDATQLFPTIGVENEQQRRLAKIAGVIGDFATQLA